MRAVAFFSFWVQEKFKLKKKQEKWVNYISSDGYYAIGYCKVRAKTKLKCGKSHGVCSKRFKFGVGKQ